MFPESTKYNSTWWNSCHVLELRNSTKAKRKIPKQFLNARVVLNMVSIWLICVTILRKLSRIRMVDTSPVVCETRIKNISWLRVSIPTATSTKYFMVSKSCSWYTSRLLVSYKCICIKIVILHLASINKRECKFAQFLSCDVTALEIRGALSQIKLCCFLKLRWVSFHDIFRFIVYFWTVEDGNKSFHLSSPSRKF